MDIECISRNSSQELSLRYWSFSSSLSCGQSYGARWNMAVWAWVTRLYGYGSLLSLTRSHALDKPATEYDWQRKYWFRPTSIDTKEWICQRRASRKRSNDTYMYWPIPSHCSHLSTCLKYTPRNAQILRPNRKHERCIQDPSSTRSHESKPPLHVETDSLGLCQYLPTPS